VLQKLSVPTTMAAWFGSSAVATATATPPPAASAAGTTVDTKSTVGTSMDHFVVLRATAPPTLSGRGKKRREGKMAMLPPPFNASVTVRNQRFRFRATAAVTNSPISTSTLTAMCGGSSGGANILYTFASSVRLRSITCYPSVGSSDSVNLSWNPAYVGQIKDSVYTTSLPDGITVTTPLRFVPPVGTLLADWFSVSISPANFCNIVAMPEGTIVDVRVDFTIVGGLQPLEVVVTGGTLSNVYYPPLDASSKLLNVALPSINY
jgi:hypothetical protein